MTQQPPIAVEARPPSSAAFRASWLRRRWSALWFLTAAQLMLVLDVTIVNVALPDIGSSLDVARGTIPWVMTAYTLAFGGLMLLGGRLADLLGARRIMTIGLVLFTGSSLLCGLAQNSTMLLTGRAAQGVGAALLSPAALALVLAVYTGPQRARALAVWGTLSGVGSALGVVVGGVLTSTESWRWIFTINVPIGVVILAVLPALVPLGTTRREPVDLPGAVLATAGTGAAIYGLVNVGSHGWSATSTWLPLVAAVVLWSAFAAAERSTPQPLMAIGLLRRRPVAAAAFLMLVATGLMVGGFFLGSFALQRAHGYSAVHVGLVFLPVAVAVVTGAHTGGRLLTRIPARTVGAAGLALAAVGDTVAAARSQPLGLVIGLTVAALGIGATFVTAFTVALADVDPGEAGLRSAVVSTFHELGGAIGVAVLSSAAGAALGRLATPAHDFTGAFTLAAVAAAVSMIVAAVLTPAVTRPAAAVGDRARPAH